MVTLGGAYYGIIVSVIGGVLGYIGTIFVNAATTDTLQLVTVPLCSIAKINIVASIETVG